MKVIFEDVRFNVLENAIKDANLKIDWVFSTVMDGMGGQIWILDEKQHGWHIATIQKEHGTFTSYRVEVHLGREKAQVVQFIAALAAERTI